MAIIDLYSKSCLFFPILPSLV